MVRISTPLRSKHSPTPVAKKPNSNKNLLLRSGLSVLIPRLYDAVVTPRHLSSLQTLTLPQRGETETLAFQIQTNQRLAL